METLLDFSKELDINLLDRVVGTFYDSGSSSVERKQAEEVLKQFQDHPDSWLRVAPILQGAQHSQSKFIALAILDKLIQTKWKVIPAEQRLGIRNFVGLLCLEWSSDASSFQQNQALINKADLTLVQILKQEWPQNWPQFIPELVMSSRAGLEVCENNMVILRLLSEEVFDYSDEQMTQAKAKRLKTQLSSEFGEIFKLCHEVLEKATRASLIVATLRCLQRYLSWVSLDFIFETNILEMLVSQFLEPYEFRNITLKCLTEVASLNTSQYDQKLLSMLTAAMQQIAVVIPPDTDLKSIYNVAGTQDQDFIQNLSLFLSSFLSKHLQLVERAGPPSPDSLLILVHTYLIKISQIEEREVFKGCLEYWSRLVLDLHIELRQLVPGTESIPLMGGNFAGSNGAPSPEIWAQVPSRLQLYTPILSQLRSIVIEHMARPEEVLISENEDGEIVRVVYQESDTITLYKSLRSVLVYLTHFDVMDTRNIMLAKLDRQVDGTEWSWHNINTLCWAIGSISGAMDFQMENFFLSTVLKHLLNLTDMKRGKDNKAVVASNIMYIIGQYPRYLRAHWKFLKTVVNKLFEFMHETHEGVQDMACDTFIKIAKKCRIRFIEHRREETQPFIDEILKDIPEHTADLAPHQVQVFYEALGCVLTAQTAPLTLQRQLEELMSLPNGAWASLVNSIKEDSAQLTQSETVKVLVNVLRTNTSVCTSLGAPFHQQLCHIYLDMLGMYQVVSKQLVSETQANERFILTPRSRLLKSVKREILKLMEVYLKNTDKLEEVARDIAPSLLSTILEDYRALPPALREHEVLSCVEAVVQKVGEHIGDMVLGILENVFESTLSMIAEDMTEYPEFRVGFFNLLLTINKHNFPVLLQLPPPIFSQTIQACLWAAKHDNRDVEDVGLNLILEIIVNVCKMNDPQVANTFFQQFTQLILGNVFAVLTDPDHRSGFGLQSEILAVFVDLVCSDKITAPLYSSEEAPAGTTNADYLRQYLSKSLRNAFPNLTDEQIHNFVAQMFKSYQVTDVFRSNLRDFLVQIKEFGGDDDWLYADERAKQAEEQQRAQLAQDMKVGGLIKPSELADDEL